MSAGNSLVEYVRRATVGVPLDIAGGVGYALVCFGAVSVFGGAGSPVLLAAVLPLLLFVPGYMVVAALFPWRDGLADDGPSSDLPLGHRLFYSFTASLVVAPLFVNVLVYATGGLDRDVLNAGLLVLVVCTAGVAAWRNRDRRAPRRLPLVGRWRNREESSLAPGTRAETAATVFMGVCVVLAAASVPAMLQFAPDGGGHSEYYLGTRGAGGELVAEGYPSEITPADGERLLVAVENHGEEPRTYTVLTRLQEVRTDGDSTRVVDECSMDVTGVTVPAADQRVISQELDPCASGEGLRVAFLFYENERSADAPASEADERLHVWVDATRAP
ncbi:DUF1616 domain-containing protein [Halomarina ordinaria]|uniref:DUF1616 domain-containing protein n=1 Tax=Halomarina ordinaria TaxID=3033939 RepID=A0ABD5UBL4_9EURY|nr:DUF1616 domain-containing protein [Halomarina sp. PSRA2]